MTARCDYMRWNDTNNNNNKQAQQVEFMLIDSNYPGEEEDRDWVFSLWDRCFHMLQKSDLGSR